MIQSENLIKLIKNDTQSNLNFYKNLLQEKSQDPKELVETASKIRKVLDFGQRRSKIQNQDMSTYSKYLKNDLKSTKIFTNIDNISLKKEGKSNPKIQIYVQMNVLPVIIHITMNVTLIVHKLILQFHYLRKKINVYILVKRIAPTLIGILDRKSMSLSLLY